MSSVITKIGNSQGVRIKKNLLEKLKLSVNDKVEINIVDNKIVIEKSLVEKESIYALFENYVDDNIKVELQLDDEVVGNEFW